MVGLERDNQHPDTWRLNSPHSSLLRYLVPDTEQENNKGKKKKKEKKKVSFPHGRYTFETQPLLSPLLQERHEGYYLRPWLFL